MFVGERCGKAEEAMKLYTSLLPNSAIQKIEKWAEGEPFGVTGQVKAAVFTLAGNEYMVSENPGAHPFTFTPAISIFVECEDEGEITHLHTELSKDGKEFMPLDNYGFSKRFTWVEDRFGVSWQLNLAN
jgi:predicted 3-demethylubiquinone-9 3-methyltransferase (glyoxalase superfamily)